MTEQARTPHQAGQAALGELLAPVRGQLLAARVLGGLSALLAIAPYVALVELGRVLLDGSPDPARVETVTRWLVATFLTQLFVHFLALTVCHFADLRLARHIRAGLVDHLSRAPLSWFTAGNSGRVRKAVQDDIKTLHHLIAHAPVDTTMAVVTPVGLVAYAFVVDWRLGLLSIATLPAYVGLQLISMKGMGEKTAAMDQRLSEVSATLIEFCDGIEVVRAFGRAGEAHDRFRHASGRFVEFFLAWVQPLMRVSALSEALVSTSVLLFVNSAVGALLVRSGQVQVIDLLTTTLISLVVPGTVLVLGSSAWSYQLAGSAALRIRELLDTPALTDPGVGDGTPRPQDATVELDRVCFSYPGSTAEGAALTDVTATLPQGSVTALVGPSGSGKSTLATMVARFHDPTSGSIRIGGVDIREIPDVYEHVAFVLQNPQLPDIPIREIVRLARPDADDEAVVDAARRARIWDDIAALPEGLDSRAQLSGGQRQQIAIAQTILADRPVVILDEATTATDPDVEAEIQAALSELAVGRTVLVIAHSPESVLGADQVIALDRGKVACVLDHPSREDLTRLMSYDLSEMPHV